MGRPSNSGSTVAERPRKRIRISGPSMASGSTCFAVRGPSEAGASSKACAAQQGSSSMDVALSDMFASSVPIKGYSNNNNGALAAREKPKSLLPAIRQDALMDRRKGDPTHKCCGKMQRRVTPMTCWSIAARPGVTCSTLAAALLGSAIPRSTNATEQGLRKRGRVQAFA